MGADFRTQAPFAARLCFYRRRVLLLLLCVCAVFPARAADRRSFDIPIQPLGQALRSFATQADVSIGLSGVDLTGKTANAVVGSETPEEALRRLLAGSGLGVEVIDPSTFRIVAVRVAPPAALLKTAEAEAPPRIDVIIVTAPKRLQKLQAVPFSIAGIAREPLKDYGLQSSGDIPSMVAGLSTTNQGPGRNRFYVRGISDGAFGGNAQSSVGIYLDETRTSFNGPDPNLQLVDIDHIEVVRGPQGTLYGAGSISGLVKIITKAPVFNRYEVEGAADASGSGRAGASGGLQAVLNAPIVDDRFAVRLVGYARHDGGYVDNVRLAKTNTNETETEGFRFQTRLGLSQDWTVRTSVVSQWVHSRDTQYYNPTMPRYARNNYLSEPYNNDFLDVHATVEGELSWANLVSTSAWLRQDVTNRYDASLAIPALIRLPVDAAAFDEKDRYDTLDHETRLVSLPGDRVEWMAGIFLSRSIRTTGARIGFTQPGPLDTFYIKTRRDKAAEAALFGEMTYAFTPAVFVTGGVRLYRGTVDVTANNTELIDDGPPDAVGQNSKIQVTPKATLGYHLDSDNLLYAQVGQGFRLGGVNIDNRVSPTTPTRNARLTVTNFASDRLWNFEIGSKSTFFAETLLINTAAYYSIWQDMQADLTRTNGLSFTANLPQVRNLGFDIDIAFSPWKELQMLANASFNSPGLGAAPTTPGGLNLNRLPRVPRLSGLLAAKYEAPLSNDIAGYASLKLEFTGRTDATGVTRETMVDSYEVVNTRFGIKRGAWNLSLYVNNVLDSRFNTFAFGNPFSLGRSPQATPLRPRTIGLNLAWTR
jgi:iron complex outermembrane receptor protein